MPIGSNPVYARITAGADLDPAGPCGCGPGGQCGGHAAALALTAAWEDGILTSWEFSGEMLRMIAEDMTSGLVPRHAVSFSELHDHVDANCYTLAVLGLDQSDAGLACTLAAEDEVTRVLGTAGLITDVSPAEAIEIARGLIQSDPRLAGAAARWVRHERARRPASAAEAALIIGPSITRILIRRSAAVLTRQRNTGPGQDRTRPRPASGVPGPAPGR